MTALGGRMATVNHKDFRELVKVLHRRTRMTLPELQASLDRATPPWQWQPLGRYLYENHRPFPDGSVQALDEMFCHNLSDFPRGVLRRAHATGDLTELRSWLINPGGAPATADDAFIPVPDALHDPDVEPAQPHREPAPSPHEGGLGGGPATSPADARIDAGPNRTARPARQRRRALTLAIALGVIIGGAAAAEATLRRPVTGLVRCTSGAPVTGIYLAYALGGGEWATPRVDAQGRGFVFNSLAPYIRPYSIHAGCGGGGTGKPWRYEVRSDFTRASNLHYICDDTGPEIGQPPYVGACRTTP